MARAFITAKSAVIIRKGTTPIVGENVVIDTVALTINITAEINSLAFFSALYDYWVVTAGMTNIPFPVSTGDLDAGKLYIGYDGTLYNAWKFLNESSKKNIKSAGLTFFNTDGTIAEEWQGIITPPLGIPETYTPYYQQTAGGTPVDFYFPGAVNEPIKVYGDANNGNIDKRAYLKISSRPPGYVFSSADMPSVQRAKLGGYVQAFGVSNLSDEKVTASDSIVGASPYTSMGLTYYTTDQMRNTGTGSFPYRQIINNTTAGLTRYQIYMKHQLLFRSNADIDDGAGTVIGKASDTLMYFVGDVLYSSAFIDGLNPAEYDFVVFVDKNGAPHKYPFAASFNLNFNSAIRSVGTAKYTLYFSDPSATNGDEWGKAGAVVVNDATGLPITGLVGGLATKSHTFDYGSTQGGRTANTDAACILVVTAAGVDYSATPVIISRAVGQNFAINAKANLWYQS
jgi:hypothetical protein